jgi:hypothetical protein
MAWLSVISLGKIPPTCNENSVTFCLMFPKLSIYNSQSSQFKFQFLKMINNLIQFKRSGFIFSLCATMTSY